MGKADLEFELKGVLQDNGRYIELEHPSIIKKAFGFLMGKELLVKISVFRYKRSDAQNRYIHGVIVPCVQKWFQETTGNKHSHDEVYMWLRLGLLGHKAEVRDVGGTQVIVMTGKRFSKMDTKEFTEAVDSMIKMLDDKGCYVPLPRKEKNANNFITDFNDD